MGLKLIDASSSLEAEDINIIVLACHCKRLLPRELASYAQTTLADEEGLLADE